MSASWRVENAAWLELRLRRLRLQLERRALWLHRAGGPLPAADWLIAAHDPDEERRFFAERADIREIDAAIAHLDAGLVDTDRRMRETSAPPALTALGEAAALSPFEVELLLLAAAPAFDGAFARAFAELHGDERRTHASLQLALALFLPDVAERMLAADCLGPGRPLRALRFIDGADDPDEPLPNRRLGVDDRMADYLRGLNRPDDRLAADLDEVFPALTSTAPEALSASIAAAIRGDTTRWTTINLVGSIADGARDIAAQACAAVGLTLYSFDVAGLSSATPAERLTHVALLGREAALGRAAFLVDAAGAERGSTTAAMIDDLVARVGAVLFVVSAERWPGDHEARAFQVPRPTRAEQRGLWRAALAPVVNSVNGELDAIVQQFDFGPPAIAAAVARASRDHDGSVSGADLWAVCRDQCGASLDHLAQRIEPAYGWDDIVVTPDVRAQLTALASQVEQRSRVYDAWGFGAQLTRGRGITALFSGASGTGKTMAAEILAAHLALDLYRIDLAGLVSKYIGETEKNLRQVFDAAERSGAMLFFDEADALFGTRTDVRDSHDRYANLEINYLLQRMESYSGVAILASNRRSSLDAAFLRRLRFVIDFPFPGAEDRRRIWCGAFPPQADVDGADFAFLSRLELAGGHIRSVAINAAFMAAADRLPIGMAHIVRAAVREYTKLAKPISAAEFGPYYEAARS